MRKRAWVRNILMMLCTLGLVLSQAVTGTVAAASMTPFGPVRFRHNHAEYVITTKSKYYRTIWQQAIAAWNQTGAFKFEKGTLNAAQVDLSTDTLKESQVMGDDVGVTDYWAEHNYFVQVLCALNPELLSKYSYSHADAVHVAEHELGHAMGLNHNPSWHSVMYYRNRSEGIHKVDIEGVVERYRTPAGEAS